MTIMQEQAVEIIKRLPDEKIQYVVNILKNIESLTVEKSLELSDAQRAYQNLQQFRKEGSAERDYQTELEEALEEKYADIY